MTESNFIALHFPAGQENIAGTLHLNVNQVGETQQGIISSMIIHVNAFSINGNENDAATYIENVLEQIESVKFTFLGTSYELIIINRAYYPAQNPFFYYTVEPAYVPNIFLAEQFIASVEDVALTPYLLDVQFGFSEFNPLISNASVGRKSERIMQSDRLEQTILPANITALLSESAEKASIQDSLYTDTGWSNARYVGSETSAAESAGIPPSITGRTFNGQVFPASAQSDYICLLPNSERITEDLFHTSNTPLPTYVTSSIGITLGQLGGIGVGSPFVEYNGTLTGSLDPGDLVVVQNTDNSFETMRIVSHNPYQKTFYVERGVARSTPGSVTFGTPFYKPERFDVFKFDDTQAGIGLVNNSRIYIAGNNTIVDTDDYGRIYSSSLCNVEAFTIDNP